MDETSAEKTHDLLLEMAGRVDDDLLTWVRELVAVGETQHAVELIGATLVADRTQLPEATRTTLVDMARSVRTELDVDRTLAVSRPVDGDNVHRFDSGPVPGVVSAVQALPARLLVGCRVLLARRLTPAGSAPGPLPHPVVLVEVSSGARNRDVLAYRIADALDRAGVRASVEVISTEQQLPGYHVEAMRSAQPVRPGVPGSGAGREPETSGPDRRSVAESFRSRAAGEPAAPQPAALHAGPARSAAATGNDSSGNGSSGGSSVDAGGNGHEPVPGDPVSGDRAPRNQVRPEPARYRAAFDDVDRDAPEQHESAASGRAPFERVQHGPAPTTLAGPDPEPGDATRPDPTWPDPAQHNPTQHNPTQHNPTQHNPAQHNPAQHDPVPDDQAHRDPASPGPEQALHGVAPHGAPGHEPARGDPGPEDRAATEPGPRDPATHPTPPEPTPPDPAPRDPAGRAAVPPAEPEPHDAARDTRGPIRGDLPLPRDPAARTPDWQAPQPGAPRASDLRPGPRPVPGDRAPRPTAVRLPPSRDQAPATVRLIPSPDPDAAESGATEPRRAEVDRAQPALAGLPERRRPEPPIAGPEDGPAERSGTPELPVRERRHRYLIERPGRDTDDEIAAEPAGTGRDRPAGRAETGNTEPLPVRTPGGRSRPDPHPFDRPSLGAGTSDSAERTVAPDFRDPSAGPADGPAGSGTGDLGLRPESVARLSASGRELLARLQAELQGGPRAGGLSANGGGTGPQAEVDPPDLAG